MSILDRIKPVFWDYKAKEIGPFKRLFNFQRLWRTSALLMSIVAIVPLLALAYFDCVATKKDAEIEISLRTARVVSNTKRTVSFFLEER
ncbi:MAG: two-component sensor histidine kinase, partial [Proteobacteria bacterium]|nr:two-component sensor histidine kinase [Pseudomonadota bacterium]